MLDRRGCTHEQAEFLKHFACFARNARWGTCGDCPRGHDGMAYPEFCVYTARYDHLLTAPQLAEQYERRK